MVDSKVITLIHSEDCHECETCGDTYADSYQLEYNGKVYGDKARAHCCGNTETTVAECYYMLLTDLGYDIQEGDNEWETSE